MSGKVAFDIRQTVANATSCSDERATASIGAFAVEGAQTAPKKPGDLAGS